MIGACWGSLGCIDSCELSDAVHELTRANVDLLSSNNHLAPYHRSRLFAVMSVQNVAFQPYAEV